MEIQYRTTGHKRRVADSIGTLLVARRIAREVHAPSQVYATRQIAAEDPAEELTIDGPTADEISPRTGKPKRKYKRRDMTAED